MLKFDLRERDIRKALAAGKDYRIFLYCYCFENIQPITPFVGLSSQCSAIHFREFRDISPYFPGYPSLLSRKWRGRRISWRNGGATRGGMGTKFGRAPDVSGPDTGSKSRC